MRSALSLVMHAFPRGFRNEFGPEMMEQIETDHAKAASRGFLSGWAFLVLTTADVVRAGLAERWHPTWKNHNTIAIETGVGLMMKAWMKDLWFAVRTLRRSLGFSVIAVGTLGLAIGANAGIFSVVDSVLLQALPYPNADRLVYIAASAPGSDFPDEFGVGEEFYLQYGEQADFLEDLALFSSFTSTLRTSERTERVAMSEVTASLFSTLEVSPILGRLPTVEDDTGVAVISHALWTSWFGQDPDIVGKSYDISGENRTIIGVMPTEFHFPEDRVLLWYPEVPKWDEITPGRFGRRVVGRVAPGITNEALVGQLAPIAARLPERVGGSANYAQIMAQHRPIVRSLEEQLVGDISQTLWILLGSVALVLLIACANVANLFVVRAESRHRDLAVRRAIGAGRGQLMRSQMSEAVVVAVLAGVLAVGLAWVTVPLLVSVAPGTIPRLGQAHVSGPTLLFTVLASVLAAIACGLVPAIRSSAPDMMRLREGGRGSTRRRHWGRDALVVGQTAMALVLLVGSGLLMRSFLELRNVDPGYDTEDIFTFQMAPEGAHLTDGPTYAQFHMDFSDRIAALPGVEMVGLINNLPLDEGVRGLRILTEETAGDPDGGVRLSRNFADGGYFRTMGISVLKGRSFERADLISNLENVVVSQTAANLLWPGQDPLGRQLQPAGDEGWWTVVGVVEDVLQDGFRDAPEPLVYFSLVGPPTNPWAISSPAYVVKTSRADEIAPEIRAMVREVAPEAPMYRVFSMSSLVARSMNSLSFTMLTLGIVSALALILGAVGLYGVLSYIVAERTKEIGVRMALGARARQVQQMVVGQGGRLVVLGTVVGLIVAGASSKVLEHLLFEVPALDFATFFGVALTMLGVGFLASYIPARRASNVDPIDSLRGE